MVTGSTTSHEVFFLSPADLLTMAAKIGRNKVVVATLLVHSVIRAIRQDRTRVMVEGFIEFKGSICLAIHSESPEAWGSQKTPFQGSCFTVPPGSRELSPPHPQSPLLHVGNLIQPYNFHPPQYFGSYNLACGSAGLVTRFKRQMLSGSFCRNVL